MKEPRQQLKTYFETGDVPTQTQFERLIDSLVHKDELIDFTIKRGSKYTEFNYIRPDGEPRIGRAYHLDISINENIDFDVLKPKLMLYRYKTKRIKSAGVIKPAGWYHEKQSDANLNGRFSELDLTSSEVSINLKPENYFKANALGVYYPTGYQISGGKWVKKGNKKYIYMQLRILITVDGQEILSKPKTVRLLHEWHNMYTFELINI